MCLKIYSLLSVGETNLLFSCCPRQLCYVFYRHHTVKQVLRFTPVVSSFLETDSMHNSLNQLLGTAWNKCKLITLNLCLWIYFLLLFSYFFFFLILQRLSSADNETQLSLKKGIRQKRFWLSLRHIKSSQKVQKRIWRCKSGFFDIGQKWLLFSLVEAHPCCLKR